MLFAFFFKAEFKYRGVRDTAPGSRYGLQNPIIQLLALSLGLRVDSHAMLYTLDWPHTQQLGYMLPTTPTPAGPRHKVLASAISGLLLHTAPSWGRYHMHRIQQAIGGGGQRGKRCMMQSSLQGWPQLIHLACGLRWVWYPCFKGKNKKNGEVMGKREGRKFNVLTNYTPNWIPTAKEHEVVFQPNFSLKILDTNNLRQTIQ